MTGLELEVDELVEVAAIVTDFDLNPVDEGVDVIIKPSQKARDNMNEFVTDMHTKSGLINELDSGMSIDQATEVVLDYVKKHVPEAGKAPLGGNSVGTDKTFLNKQMPELIDYLHYRVIDVSSIKELAKRWLPKAYFNAPEKTGGHRALGDIRDSIDELKYYRAVAFVDDVTTNQAIVAAREISEAREKKD